MAVHEECGGQSEGVRYKQGNGRPRLPGKPGVSWRGLAWASVFPCISTLRNRAVRITEGWSTRSSWAAAVVGLVRSPSRDIYDVFDCDFVYSVYI